MPEPQTNQDFRCLDSIAAQAMKISNMIERYKQMGLAASRQSSLYNNATQQNRDIRIDDQTETTDSIRKFYKANPSLEYIKKATRNI